MGLQSGNSVNVWVDTRAICAVLLLHNVWLYWELCAVFQAYGMSVMPLNLIKGTRSVLYERLENTEDIDDVEHQIEKLKSKVSH